MGGGGGELILKPSNSNILPALSLNFTGTFSVMNENSTLRNLHLCPTSGYIEADDFTD